MGNKSTDYASEYEKRLKKQLADVRAENTVLKAQLEGMEIANSSYDRKIADRDKALAKANEDNEQLEKEYKHLNRQLLRIAAIIEQSRTPVKEIKSKFGWLFRNLDSLRQERMNDR